MLVHEMFHTYPLDPNRRRQPGILDIVRRYAQELDGRGGQPRTPARGTQPEADLVVVRPHRDAASISR
jgi:hypothetical protein